MQHLLSAVATIGDSAIISVSAKPRSSFRTVKVTITGGTATVILRGRMAPDDPTWTDLITFDADATYAIALPPQVMVSVTAIAGGAVVDAWLDAYTA